MAKDEEKDIKRGKSKERKSKNKNPKKDKLVPKGQAKVVECSLRKLVKEEKAGQYTEDDAKRIYDSVKVKKSGFPAYTASMYSNMVEFAPKKRGKKIPPVGYGQIKQIVKIPNDANSFLLHVPKTRKTKQFSGLFTWTDPEGGKILENALKKYQETLANDGNGSQDITPKKDYPLEQRGATHEADEGLFDRRLRSEARISSTPAHRANGLSETDIVDAGPIKETYTLYNPKRWINRRPNYNARARSESAYSTSSSYDENYLYQGFDDDDSTEDDEADSEYICRDPKSIFYGERMSPKSQYVDKLLRAAAQTNKYE
ncbi:unnamed protein product [Rodentolepis nana]|uniref:DUF5733 domain-containing protein n=1 Tax=Rodentolepis nana TaxID=102285 RepID=A0A0R3TT54_RODNA|nr:unnamed protein product [Rodentolepis nana]